MNAVMEQRMAALSRANEIRLPRAALKREIKARNTKAPEVLRESIPEWLDGMPIEEVLRAVPRLHKHKIASLLHDVGYRGEKMDGRPISPLMPVGRMTKRQRLLMADLIEEWEGRRVAA